ncbi:MAG TPA: septal ring lytic transglycosylase RlpA family protein [Terriglobales bacterium]|nr:septal ring lytic transglycosylase RlpA family protein [Terriglobales bacterium]
MGAFEIKPRTLRLAALLAGVTLLAGCGGGNQHARTRVPAPPPTSAETFNIPANAKPLFVEIGLASWYGPPYHNRPAANGEIYDMNAPTAAHRTLPLGSIVRVTNLSTGQRTLVRINDRGPFVEGRIIDLSLAAASEIGVRRAGIAKVRVEVMRAPAPLDSGGRWAVQIGALEDEEVAAELKAKLVRRYRTAKVLSFPSPTGDWWVRVRVLQDDRKRAQEVARDTHTPQGDVFLVRLD